MDKFLLFAEPWWVNLLIFIPAIVYYLWQRNKIVIKKQVLITATIFGAAFGFVEAAVVVYLRAAIGLLPGYGGTLLDVSNLSSTIYQQAQILGELPRSLLIVELFRELSTMIMLISIAFLAVKSKRERWAMFLWAFAFWDIFYYIGLWTTVGWPGSLLDKDVLFLIPVVWYSQVWFPILISLLVIIAVVLCRKK